VTLDCEIEDVEPKLCAIADQIANGIVKTSEFELKVDEDEGR